MDSGPVLSPFPSLLAIALVVQVLEVGVGTEKVCLRALEAVLDIDLLQWVFGGDGGVQVWDAQALDINDARMQNGQTDALALMLDMHAEVAKNGVATVTGEEADPDQFSGGGKPDGAQAQSRVEAA